MRELWLQLEGRPGWLAGGAFVVGILLASVVALLVGGDGSGPEAATTTIPPVATSTTLPVAATTSTLPGEPTLPPTTSTTVAAEPLSTNPLTGEPLPSVSTQGVLAVKVDNAQAARPQIGLGTAGMIIEVPVEAGLTRFTAMYFGDLPPFVAPVRSVRPVDADLMAPFRPLFVHTGGRDFVVRLIDAAGVRSFDVREEVGQRIERPAPHNLGMAPRDVELIIGGPPAVDVFGFGTPLGGDAAAAVEITVPFSAVTEVTWAFDGAVYLRSHNGEAHSVLPAVGGEPEPFTVDSVLVLQAAQRSAGYQDANGADVPTFDVIGSGRFWLFSSGRTLSGDWSRAAQTDGFELMGDDGSAVSIPVGRLMVQIVDRSVAVTWR